MSFSFGYSEKERELAYELYNIIREKDEQANIFITSLEDGLTIMLANILFLDRISCNCNARILLTVLPLITRKCFQSNIRASCFKHKKR